MTLQILTSEEIENSQVKYLCEHLQSPWMKEYFKSDIFGKNRLFRDPIKETRWERVKFRVSSKVNSWRYRLSNWIYAHDDY